jgi:hypothetical protein
MVEAVDDSGGSEPLYTDEEIAIITAEKEAAGEDLEGEIRITMLPVDGEEAAIPEDELMYYTMIDPDAENDPDAVKRDGEEVVDDGIVDDTDVIVTMVPEDGEVVDGEVVITMMPEDGGEWVCPEEVDENGDPMYCIATTGGPVAPVPTLVNGVLTVTGTEANDKIRLSRASDNTKLAVKVNGVTTLFSTSSITSIIVNALAGDDKVQVHQKRGGISIGAQINGGDGNDNLAGGNGNDSINGGAGNDRIRGGRGNDALDGGAGDDKLHGGKGDDVLTSGGGNDKLKGGKGEDTRDGKKGPKKASAARLAYNGMRPITDDGAGDDMAIVIDDGDGPMFFPDDSGDLILM